MVRELVRKGIAYSKNTDLKPESESDEVDCYKAPENSFLRGLLEEEDYSEATRTSLLI